MFQKKINVDAEEVRELSKFFIFDINGNYHLLYGKGYNHYDFFYRITHQLPDIYTEETMVGAGDIEVGRSHIPHEIRKEKGLPDWACYINWFRSHTYEIETPKMFHKPLKDFFSIVNEKTLESSYLSTL